MKWLWWQILEFRKFSNFQNSASRFITLSENSVASSIYYTWTPTRTPEQTGRRYRTSGKTKYQTSVHQKTDPIFSRLTFHNKYIDSGQKCISTGENSLKQQVYKLCMLGVQGRCKRARRNCINGLQQFWLRVELSFFSNKQVYCW